MTRPKVSFRVIGDSGPLSLSWYPGPWGDAVEAKRGRGVGFFSPNGELLGVEFDDVQEKSDRQALVFDHCTVLISVAHGKVSYSLGEGPVGRKRKSAGDRRGKAEDVA